MYTYTSWWNYIQILKMQINILEWKFLFVIDIFVNKNYSIITFFYEKTMVPLQWLQSNHFHFYLTINSKDIIFISMYNNLYDLQSMFWMLRFKINTEVCLIYDLILCKFIAKEEILFIYVCMNIQKHQSNYAQCTKVQHTF